MRKDYVRSLLELQTAETGTVAGNAYPMHEAPGSIQAVCTGSGSIAATVAIEVSNSTTAGTQHWITLGTITLSGTAPQTDGFAFATRWDVIRSRVVSITGTSAAVTVDMAS